MHLLRTLSASNGTLIRLLTGWREFRRRHEETDAGGSGNDFRVTRIVLSDQTLVVRGGLAGSLEFTLDGVELKCVRKFLRTRRRGVALVDLQHAGIAWIENSGATAGRGQVMSAAPRFLSFLCVWRDTNDCERLSGAGDDRDDMAHLTAEAIAATPAGLFASMVESSIAGARSMPIPKHLPGSYLPTNGHAVWIPGIGLSTPPWILSSGSVASRLDGTLVVNHPYPIGLIKATVTGLRVAPPAKPGASPYVRPVARQSSKTLLGQGEPAAFRDEIEHYLAGDIARLAG